MLGYIYRFDQGLPAGIRAYRHPFEVLVRRCSHLCVSSDPAGGDVLSLEKSSASDVRVCMGNVNRPLTQSITPAVRSRDKVLRFGVSVATSGSKRSRPGRVPQANQ